MLSLKPTSHKVSGNGLPCLPKPATMIWWVWPQRGDELCSPASNLNLPAPLRVSTEDRTCGAKWSVEKLLRGWTPHKRLIQRVLQHATLRHRGISYSSESSFAVFHDWPYKKQESPWVDFILLLPGLTLKGKVEIPPILYGPQHNSCLFPPPRSFAQIYHRTLNYGCFFVGRGA